MPMRLLHILLCWFCLASPACGQNWDIKTLRTLNVERNRRLDGAFTAITNSSTPVAVGGIVLLSAVGYFADDSLTQLKALNMGASIIGAAFVTQALKYSFNRTRPFNAYPDLDKQALGGGPSFPSGHTSNAFSVATSISLSYPKWYVIAPAYLWAGSVGYSRMHLGVHYPSDVLAGAVVGAGSAYLSHKITERLVRHGRKRRLARPRQP